MPTMELERCSQCSAGGPLLACDDEDDGLGKPHGVAKPRYCNNCMIGKKVKVFWPVDESWYAGEVQEYDAKTGEHRLMYPDGDTEWVKIGEIIAANNATSGNGSDAPENLDPLPSHLGEAIPLDAMAGGPHGQYYGSGPYPPPPHSQNTPYPPVPQYPSSSVVTPGGMAHNMPPYMYPGYGHGGGGMYSSPYGAVLTHQDTKSGGDGLLEGRRKSGPKPWSKEEDQLLLRLAHTMQWPMKWTVVAQSLPDRTGKQCRERYVNHLNPRLKSSDWTPVEDATIFHLYNTIGSHWAKMSKIIPGRTDNGIKNRFHNIRRQYEREDTHRLRLSSVDDFPDELRLDRLRPFPDYLAGKSTELWDMKSAVGVLAAQSVLGGTSTSRNSRFGPFRDATTVEGGDLCVRCGLLVPSVHCGTEICTKTGWCQTCARIPPNISGNLLRECLNLRRCENKELRDIVESWEELFVTANNPSDDKVESKDAPAVKVE